MTIKGLKRAGAALAAVLLAAVLMLLAGPRAAYADDLAAPANPHFEYDEDASGWIKGVTACWEPVAGAAGYYVTVYWEGMSYSSTQKISDGAVTSSDVTDAVTDGAGTYSFRVSAYDNDEFEGDEAESESVTVYRVVVSTSSHGDGVYICAKEGSKIGPLVEAAYLSTLTNESGAYKHNDGDGNPDTLVAVTPDWAGSYASKIALLAAACWPSGGEGYEKTLSEDTYVSTVWLSDMCSVDGDLHSWEQKTQKAWLNKSGAIYYECTTCHEGQDGGIIPLVPLTEIKLSTNSYTYDGKAKKPKVTVMSSDGPLATTEYKVTYSNNVNAGTAAKATVTMTSDYYAGTKSLTFKIGQAANSAKAKKMAVKKTVKAAAVGKKVQKVALPKVTAKFGKAVWKVAAKDKKGVLTLKAGKVVVKKGAKKGTYVIKLKATVAGTKNYKAAASKVVTVKVVVK